jgi:hypothetical protein
MFLVLTNCLAFSICNILNQVARTKSTARPMTSEELDAAGVSPTGEEVRDSRMEDPAHGTVHGSGSREEGEIRSMNKSGGEEDLSNIDDDLNELVAMKAPSHPQLLSLASQMLRSTLLNDGFFTVGDGRPPCGEQVPAPEANEVVVFQDFFTCGLRFPCGPILPSILERFSVKIHQFTPTSFLNVSKFFWIMRTFKCTFGADTFACLFEVVIEKDILKLDDGQYYEAHYA